VKLHYIPKKGDLITIDFDPQSGHEQQGRRPALVVSNSLFGRTTNFVIVCPITNKNRSSHFHVAVPAETGLTGFVMSEQLKSLDFAARNAKRIGTVSQEFLDEVLARIDPILF